jgi:hypothetical protein
MNAKDIRFRLATSMDSSAEDQAFALTEIAAQLSDMNKTLALMLEAFQDVIHTSADRDDPAAIRVIRP